MEEICRLCLSFSNETLKLSDDSIGLKIQCLFSVKVEYKELLPNQICTICMKKINEISEFHKKIIENEKFLLDHIKYEDDINSFYMKLKDKLKVKQEVFNNKENESINIKPINIEESSEYFKEEDDHLEDTSDDEILSTLKQDKIQSEIKVEGKLEEINQQTDKHKCLTCFQILDTQKNLLKHYGSVHFVNNRNDNRSQYTIDTSDNSVVYKCKLCSKEYRSKKNIHRHLDGHSIQRPYLCKICGRTYKTASEIIRHGRVHGDTKLFCPYQCGYSTVYMGALRCHTRRHEKSDCKYQCEQCGKGFQVRTWYEQHQNLHSGVKPYVCDICGAAFHMDRYLTAHRSTVHQPSSNTNRYICVHCSLPYDSKNALSKHLEVHGIKTSYLCDLCGKTLSNAEQLRCHKKTHLGQKPYSCSTCNKSFARNSNLIVHVRAHAAQRPHACARCGRAYTQRSALRRHWARHHPGVEPMDCEKCQKSFPSTRLLNLHKKNCKTD